MNTVRLYGTKSYAELLRSFCPQRDAPDGKKEGFVLATAPFESVALRPLQRSIAIFVQAKQEFRQGSRPGEAH